VTRTTTLEVLRTGPLALIEDLGRPGKAQLGVTRSALATSDKLNLQWTNAIPAHSLNPERMVPKTETQQLLAPTTARN